MVSPYQNSELKLVQASQLETQTMAWMLALIASTLETEHSLIHLNG